MGTNRNCAQKAGYYLEKRVRIFEDYDHAELVEGYIDLGILLHNKELFREAIYTLEKGLKIPTTIDNRADLLLQLAEDYSVLEEFEKALYYLDLFGQEVEKAEIEQGEKEEHFFHLYEVYAQVYKNRRDYGLAEQYFFRAMALAGKAESPIDIRDIGLLLMKRAILYRISNQPEKGLQDYQRAIELFLPGYRAGSLWDLPEEEELIQEANLVDAFAGKAACLYLLFQKENKEKYLELALEGYHLAAKTERLMQEFYALESSQLASFKERRKYKEVAQKMLFEWYERRGEERLKKEAFRFCEQNRAFLLFRNLQLAKSLQKGTKEHEQFVALQKQITDLSHRLYQTEMGSNEDKVFREMLRDSLIRLKEERTVLGKKLRSHTSETGLFGTKSFAGLEEVQNALSKDQCLVEYFLGEEWLFIYALTKNEFTLWKKPVSPELTSAVVQLRKTLTDSALIKRQQYKPDFAWSAHFLYRELLAEVMDWKPQKVDRLVLVTDGILGYIPFAALPVRPPSAGFQYYDLKFLIQEASLAFAPSAALFVLQSGAEPKRGEALFAGFAPAYPAAVASTGEEPEDEYLAMMERDGEYELKGARREVAQVHSILGGDEFAGMVCEQSFRDLAAKYRILLLSMHSVVNEDQPDFSRLIFSPEGCEGDDDQSLHAIELSSLNLEADLAVLSACNTGLGKVYEGEGIVSMSSAFFSAGVPGAVVTLWKVSDQYSPEIVVEFFRQLKKGMPKDVALRNAQLNYLSNLQTPELAHPYLWAGFIAAGNVKPLFPKGPKGWHYALGGGLVLVLFGLFFRKRKKNGD